MTLEHLWETLRDIEDGRIKAKEAMETITLNVPSFNGGYAVLGDLTRDKTDELINDLFQHIKTRGPIINGMDRSIYQVVIEQWFARHFT